MRKDKNIIILIIICFLTLPVLSASAKAPERPDIHQSFDTEKEAKIIEISGDSSKEVFERLTDIDFIINEKFMYKAIYEAFNHRQQEGINLALNYLRLPKREEINDELIDRSSYLHVARKVLEVFPDKSITLLVELYEYGNAVTRGNVIMASGKIDGGKPIRDLLINALDDKTFFEEESEMDGELLRICDVAYNQVVLRYKIKNVLRTIGYSHTIEVRDYHINILRSML